MQSPTVSLDRIAVSTMPFAPAVLFVSGGHDYPALPGPLLKKPFLAHDLIRVAERIIQERTPAAANQVLEAWEECLAEEPSGV